MPGVVTVACKIPNGMRLHLDELVTVSIPNPGGGTKEGLQARPKGEPIYIAGPAHHFGQAPKVLVVGGYALTPNIDGDFFEEWMKTHAEMDCVKNKLIKAFAKEGDAKGWSAEHAKQLSGLHPVIPDKDERRPKPLNAAVSAVVTDDGKRAA